MASPYARTAPRVPWQRCFCQNSGKFSASWRSQSSNTAKPAAMGSYPCVIGAWERQTAFFDCVLPPSFYHPSLLLFYWIIIGIILIIIIYIIIPYIFSTIIITRVTISTLAYFYYNIYYSILLSSSHIIHYIHHIMYVQ